MKRFRISTLMLLVVIAALIVALFAERKRSATLLALAQAERDQARMMAERAQYVAQMEIVANQKLADANAKLKRKPASSEQTTAP